MKKPIQHPKTKGKYFYSHLVETSLLSLELGDMDLSSEERVELISLAESQLHHIVVDTILSQLSEEDKKIFLQHLVADNHEKLWNHLNTKVKNIEEKIKQAAEDLKKELHTDIQEAKKK